MSDQIADAIRDAAKKCERYGQPVTPKYVEANVDVGEVTMGYAEGVVQRHVRARIPAVLKQLGYVIADTETRERKLFARVSQEEWEAQIRVKEESSVYDVKRLRCDKALSTFWAEKNKAHGYGVYVETFWDDVVRIYAMEGLQPPALASLNGRAEAA